MRSLQVLAGALASALVIVAVALTFVLNGDDRRDGIGSVPVWPFIAVGVVAVLSVVMIETVGFRARPASGDVETGPIETRSPYTIYQSMMILRFAFAEAVAIVSVAATFAVRPTTIWIYLMGGAIALVLIALYVWPNDRVIERSRQALERAGLPSDLSELRN